MIIKDVRLAYSRNKMLKTKGFSFHFFFHHIWATREILRKEVKTVITLSEHVIVDSALLVSLLIYKEGALQLLMNGRNSTRY